MVNIIYKFELRVGRNDLTLPAGSRILSVANQREKVVMWAAVAARTGANPVRWQLDVLMTGTNVSEEFTVGFVGTVLLSDGEFVLHVFARRLP